MPSRQPFTALCQAAARSPLAGRADLHIHTTFSDGSYTPAEVLDLARRSGLAAIALTDHDTVAALPAAREAARGTGVEIVPGVEITAEYRERELHLLGYFFRLDDAALNAALDRLREHRVGRFWEMVGRLRGCGVSLDEGEVRRQVQGRAVGRRHLAELLVQARRASSMREAFARFLHDQGRAVVPKQRLPVAEAIALVRAAGGVAAWAHPSYDCIQETLAELHGLGLRAIEAVYPGFRTSRIRQLRGWAALHGLAITGGSDCHGPGHPSRSVGSCTISDAELAALRSLAQ
jgi:hypothetical protein